MKSHSLQKHGNIVYRTSEHGPKAVVTINIKSHINLQMIEFSV